VAIGDNIPGIFGNLPESVMKSGGDPQYVMDLFQGLDADREMELRTSALSGGIPPYEDIPPFEQHFQITGDPFMSANIALQDTLAAQSANNDTSGITAGIGAEALYNFSPGTVDTNILNEYSDSLGISSDALATAYNDLNESIDASMFSMPEEGLFDSIPVGHVPHDEDREPVGAGERFAGSPIGKLFGKIGDINFGDIFAAGAGARFDNMESTTEPLSIDGDVYTDLQGNPVYSMKPQGPAEWGGPATVIPNEVTFDEPSGTTTTTQTVPETSENEIQRIKRLWDAGELSPTERDNRLEAYVLSGMDNQSKQRFEQGDQALIFDVNRTVNEFKTAFGSDTTLADESDRAFEQRIVSADGAPSPTIGTFEPASSSVVPTTAQASVVPETITMGEGLGIPEYSTATGPAEMFQAYGATNIPNYFGGLETSIGRQYRPLLGSHLLQQIGTPLGSSIEGRTYGSFLEDVKPETYTPIDWNKLSPSWNSLMQYVTSQASSGGTDPDAAEALSKENPIIATTLTETGSAGKRNAISLALARYHAGKPVVSSYANRAVASSLEDIYDRTEADTIRYGGANTTIKFLENLIKLNPERFG
jgi:hypothetical protein